MKKNTFIKITPSVLSAIEKVISASLEYENLTERKSGITAEVGEILICHKLNLFLIADQINAGYDAVDRKENKYQIKTRRIIGDKIKGRVGIFSKHEFDFAILVLLNKKYKFLEGWKMNYKTLCQLAEANKRRNPAIRSFIKNAEEIK
ncbi:hypothetical protein KKC83_01190 [Patescibacteria group bacterium]|nr:hypothetical protein [Candidatus Falkowbacteria bacterium]MBU3905749.1 hypothetical protein [Patescibacteria group bacterium]MBU4015817.1 hypothetical protein [Patescibacteria group bacterium]MBU4026145.1 hypothetical protein [Patescibacteria group bacterium]MBU4072846.1 hypothetical protein [Patescibacteria group bacterium]